MKSRFSFILVCSIFSANLLFSQQNFQGISGINTENYLRVDVSKILQPKVYEQIELFGIVFRLAGASEYQFRTFKEYDDAINKHFAAFKTHQVILAAQSARSSTGVSLSE